MDKHKDPLIAQLYKAVLQLQSSEDCDRFFDDLCTIGEMQSLAQRLEVARMLDEGMTYSHIEEVTGASTATISRVKRCLHYGSDGYRTVLDRMKR